MTEEFILIEVLPVQSVLNGTANTIVSLDQLHKEHRRHKRDIDKKTLRFRKTHRAKNKLPVSEQSYRCCDQNEGNESNVSAMSIDRSVS